MLPNRSQNGIHSFIVIAEFQFVHHMNRSNTMFRKYHFGYDNYP